MFIERLLSYFVNLGKELKKARFVERVGRIRAIRSHSFIQDIPGVSEIILDIRLVYDWALRPN